jgi:hypothetical protein
MKMLDGTIQSVLVPYDKVPAFLKLPVLGVPFILQPSAHLMHVAWWVFEPRNPPELLKQYAAERVVLPEVDLVRFCRFLAKTAHALTAALVNPACYKPLLNGLILGTDREILKYVGGALDKDKFDHARGGRWSLFPVLRTADAKLFLVAEIQIFPAVDSPIYLIVVGEGTEAYAAGAPFQRA